MEYHFGRSLARTALGPDAAVTQLNSTSLSPLYRYERFEPLLTIFPVNRSDAFLKKCRQLIRLAIRNISQMVD